MPELALRGAMKDFAPLAYVVNALALVLALALTACGPTLADGGGETFDDTGETAGDGDGELPTPGEAVCVEFFPDQKTCWVGWEVVHARVILPCQVADLVTSGAWGPSVETDHEDGWGKVRCHDGVTETCFYSADNVMLREFEGVWAPTLSPDVWQLEPVEPPCGVVPGDGDGDPACDHLGCPCASGGCVENLVCDLSEHCSPCPPGSPGCPCADSGICEVGTCYSGEDVDGTLWSMCYPADLLGCVINPCPGDAYCTDNMQCAWAD